MRGLNGEGLASGTCEVGVMVCVCVCRKPHIKRYQELSLSNGNESPVLVAAGTSNQQATRALSRMSGGAVVVVVVVVPAQLGPKAPALAWPEAALALSRPGPGQSPHSRLGSGPAWLKPRLLVHNIMLGSGRPLWLMKDVQDVSTMLHILHNGAHG